jgi:hypothetical protein
MSFNADGRGNNSVVGFMRIGRSAVGQTLGDQ